ncbi:hypothetical protein [Planosporangium flavigriseum]|nr:hypothetical protein [Planosporangium flavigriseum]
MSRQELAEAVNAYLWKEHRRKVTLDSNYVGKLERGQHRWPGELYREAFRTVLKAASDADLGFYIIRTFAGECGDPVAAGDHDLGNRGCLDDSSAAVLEGLRSALNVYRPLTDSGECGQPVGAIEVAAAQIHDVYQRADYDAAGRMLPDLIRDAHELAVRSSGGQRQRALRVQAATYIAASKLASKAGDGQLAWVTADRAATAAQLAESTALSAAAAYQVACALLRFPDKCSYAEELTTTTAEDLARPGCAPDADRLSTRGSLLLLAALIAAQRNDRQTARQYLAQAAALAERLGRDDNRVWTAFGPTNVAIHEVSVAAALGDVDRATQIGERLDTSRLPRPLIGRRAQVHLDLAAAYAQRRSGDALAVLHLLEAERIAQQSVRVNVAARTLLAKLLRRERSAATPGLRPLAERAGVAA